VLGEPASSKNITTEKDCARRTKNIKSLRFMFYRNFMPNWLVDAVHLPTAGGTPELLYLPVLCIGKCG
ncbi:MAG: hypothetical protein K2K19_02025, partial [Acetatifactor sp.]|nr:hypothetical protein [Acetatifactor sp.]